MTYMEKITSSADLLKERVGVPEIAVVLGSGLGDLEYQIKDPVSVPYVELPGFPKTTVVGHAGRFTAGKLCGKNILCMCGRYHSYEGHSMEDLTLPFRVMAMMGIKKLLLSNAAGGVNVTFKPGCLMLLDDFINLSGKNPLIGANMDAFGPRFPDMTNAYDPEFRKIARETAEEYGIDLRSGVYCMMSGPTYETPAEVRMARILGADALGMSTVPETIVARHSGMRVLAISCITNMAAGILDQPITHQEVIDTGKRVANDFIRLVSGIIEKI